MSVTNSGGVGGGLSSLQAAVYAAAQAVALDEPTPDPNRELPEDTEEFDLSITINDTGVQTHPEFLTLEMTRKVQVYFSGKHEVPSFKLIHRIMKEYSIPEDAVCSNLDMNWNTESAVTKVTGDKDMYDHDSSRRWFSVTFEFPISKQQFAQTNWLDDDKED